MRTLGIIAAAGRAKRFGGTLKELLPCENYDSFLSRNVAVLNTYCDEIIVITNRDKIHDHARDLLGGVLFAIQIEKKLDIYGAMREGMLLDADEYIFVMGDTYWDAKALERIPVDMFSMGIFETDQAERFGMLRIDHEQGIKIVNKQQGKKGHAWGILAFHRAVRDYWLDRYLDDYTQAINFAIKHFDYQTFGLEYYYDIASFDDYVKFLGRLENEGDL